MAPKKPVLATVDEVQELKTQLQTEIGNVQKELRVKVAGAQKKFEEQLEAAKKELTEGLDTANEATRRLAEDAHAHTEASCGDLDSRLGGEIDGLKERLDQTEKDLVQELQDSEANTRQAMADELRDLCTKLDQELDAVRQELSNSFDACFGKAEASMQGQRQELDAALEAARQYASDEALAAQQAAFDELSTFSVAQAKDNEHRDEKSNLSQAEIWLKLERLGELLDEAAEKAREDLNASAADLTSKLTEVYDESDRRLGVLEETATRLRAGVSEVQNMATRKVNWVIRQASSKIRRPQSDAMKMQAHVSWFSPQFDAAGMHGLQLELQVYRHVDPPVEGQEAGDCAVFLWACKGANLVYKLGLGNKIQHLEKKFNGRVPYGTPRLCFFQDQINREDDTLVVSAEFLEAIKDLEAPIQKADPTPLDWRMTLQREGLPVGEEHLNGSNGSLKIEDGPLPIESNIIYSQHINNRLLDQVKEHVEQMRSRTVRCVEWRVEQASMLRRCFPPGDAMCSKDFSAAGVDNLQFVFYPSGYSNASEGYCSLFLNAPAGAMMKCSLLIGKERRDANHTSDQTGAFGRTNFCLLEAVIDPDEDTILIRLDIQEAHQDVVAKVAHAPPKPGDRRSLSEQDGAVSAPIGSAVKLRRSSGGAVLEDVRILPSLWAAKYADDPTARPQGFHSFSEMRSRVSGPSAPLPSQMLVSASATSATSGKASTAVRVSSATGKRTGDSKDAWSSRASSRGPPDARVPAGRSNPAELGGSRPGSRGSVGFAGNATMPGRQNMVRKSESQPSFNEDVSQPSLTLPPTESLTASERGLLDAPSLGYRPGSAALPGRNRRVARVGGGL